MRTGRAGRPVYCYVTKNLTKGGWYSLEFFEDDDGNPYGWCNCAASVVCKHIKAALEELHRREPNFGEVQLWREEAAIDLTRKGE